MICLEKKMESTSFHNDMNPGQVARIARAAKLTSSQIQEAIKLCELHFAVDASQKMLPAILQALATNYAASA